MQSNLDIEFLRQTQLYRPGRADIDRDFSSGRWSPPIDRLLAAGYSFLPYGYTGDGFLFRGMQNGLDAARAGGCFGHFEGDDEMCQVEQAMGVHFLTSEISDAVTVSRLHDSPQDAAIIAVHASWFNDRLHEHAAAVLAVGDAGIVFRYPLVTTPLPADAVRAVFVSASRKSNTVNTVFDDRLVTVSGMNRKELEQNLDQNMRRLGITAASAYKSGDCPARYPQKEAPAA